MSRKPRRFPAAAVSRIVTRHGLRYVPANLGPFSREGVGVTTYLSGNAAITLPTDKAAAIVPDLIALGERNGYAVTVEGSTVLFVPIS